MRCLKCGKEHRPDTDEMTLVENGTLNGTLSLSEIAWIRLCKNCLGRFINGEATVVNIVKKKHESLYDIQYGYIPGSETRERIWLEEREAEERSQLEAYRKSIPPTRIAPLIRYMYPPPYMSPFEHKMSKPQKHQHMAPISQAPLMYGMPPPPILARHRHPFVLPYKSDETLKSSCGICNEELYLDAHDTLQLHCCGTKIHKSCLKFILSKCPSCRTILIRKKTAVRRDSCGLCFYPFRPSDPMYPLPCCGEKIHSSCSMEINPTSLCPACHKFRLRS